MIFPTVSFSPTDRCAETTAKLCKGSARTEMSNELWVLLSWHCKLKKHFLKYSLKKQNCSCWQYRI